MCYIIRQEIGVIIMITNVERRSLFEKLYDECKDSRDFQSSRKWQTIVIYIALLTLYLGNFGSLQNAQEGLLPIVTMVLCFVGYICFSMALSLRSLHIQYTKCCQVISYALMCKETLNDFKTLNEFIETHFVSQEVTLKRIFQRIENRVTIFLLVLILMPILILLNTFNANSILYILISIIHFVICLYLMYINEIKAEKWKTWVLDFDKIK